MWIGSTCSVQRDPHTGIRRCGSGFRATFGARSGNDAGSVARVTGRRSWHTSSVPWLVSDARVFASADVASNRSARRQWPARTRRIRGCAGVASVPLGPHDRVCVSRSMSPTSTTSGVVIKTVRMRAPPRRHAGVERGGQVIEAEAGAFARWGLDVGDVDRGPGRRRVTGRRPRPLVLVATPIGNLGDLAPRAVEALRRGGARVLRGHRAAPAGCCSTPGSAANAWRSSTSTPSWRGSTTCSTCSPRGGDVAVVTDAGTPGISDPGERLVRAALDAGLRGHGRARPGGRRHGARRSAGCRRRASCSKASCHAPGANAPNAWPRSPPSPARS